MVIREFALNAVEITEPVLVNAFEKEQQYLRSIETDRLLAGFRETAGLEKKAERYTGGWENSELSGHTLGHYMIALAQLYAATEAEDIKERLEYILAELLECQAQDGYLFASGKEIFDKLEANGLVWMPWYTMHKILSGLLSVYHLAKLPQALVIAKKLGGWICGRVLRWSDKELRNVRCIADGGMNDCLYELYKETGEEALIEAAERFDETELYKKIVDGNDVLQNKHANNTIPKFLGAVNRYMALGESERFYLDAAKVFFDMVVEDHTYITGGNGELEHFRAPGALGADRNQYNCETCSSYNMLKLAERLYAVTGEKQYMDYYERTFLNAILGSQNPEDGMVTFFQPMETGFFKTYGTPFSRFWCCTGTGMESFTNLNHAIYHRTDERLYVNMYIASVLRAEEFGLYLTQTTDMDRFETVSFVMKLDAPKKFTLCLRVPEWSGKDVKVTVNGTVPEYKEENGYLLLKETWENGDRIELMLTPQVALHPLQDMPNCVAATYGPFVLAAGLEHEDMTTELMGVNVIVPTKKLTVRERIVLNEEFSMEEWFENCNGNFIKHRDEPAFSLQGTDADKELVFVPYYKKYNERYGVYFDYYDKNNLPEDLRALQEEQRRQEEEERLAAEAARQAEEEERRRKEEEERLAAEAARQAEEEERRRKEEEERLAAEAAEAERLRLEAEAEEARKIEEEARRIAAQNAADAERAAEVAEAKVREEEANLQAAKLAQERAEAEAATLKAQAEAEAAKAAKAEELARQAKANKEANKASKKAAKKKKKYRVYRDFSAGKVIAWIVAGLAAVVLLYLFATPISKVFFIGKDAVDTFLADRFPKVAETVKVKGNGDAMPVFKDAGGTEYFIANANSFVTNHAWPQGYQASVVRLNGKQYICIEGKDLKVYYLNEVAENESKHVYLEKGDRKALYFWEYTFENPELLCPLNGVYNTSGVEQYVFYTNAGSTNVHILDAATLAECKVILPEKTILRVLNVEEYLEEEKTVRINMKIEDVPYSFAVPKKTGALVPDGYAIGLDGVVCTVNETGVRFEAYVVSAGAYLGKLIGEMEYTNQVYLVNQLGFFAYADEEYGDVSDNPVLLATDPKEAQRERVEVLGDRGERLLVPVRDDVKRYEYDEKAFLTEKNGEISYIRDGKTVSVKGIDVSKRQGSIDWEKVAASGVEYAMICLGMRGDEPDGKCRVDANYGRNVKGALGAGVEVGVYFTSRATTVEEAKEEAQFVLNNMKGYDITWPVVLDTVENIGEETRASAVSRKDRTVCAKAFMDEIAAAGYTPVLYTDARWSVLKLDMGELGDYDLWYTSNGELTDYPYHYTMWQYSNEGGVPGIDGNGDINISFVDYGETRSQEQ